jgi:iron complex transport system substrate-binding protein
MTISRPARRRASTVVVALALALASLPTAATSAGVPAGETTAVPRSAPPRRIIAVAPSAAELLFALGLGERVVGVGDYVTWPPEARALPRLGGLLDPRLETVAALRPDLAVLLPSQRELGERLAALGVGVLEVPHESLADVERAARAIAKRAGEPAAGERFAARWRRELAPAPLPRTASVVVVVTREPGALGRPLVAGPGNFLDELIGRLGLRNAFADAPLAWPQVGLEEVLARRPDVIVELQARAPTAEEAAALRRDWGAVPQLPAVRDGRVVVLGGDHALVPGPRLPRLYRELRAALAGALR